MKKTDKELEEKIFQELKEGLSYSQIQKKHPGIGKATIHRIKNERDPNVKASKLNNLSLIMRERGQFARDLMNVSSNLQFAADKVIQVITQNKVKIERGELELKKVSGLIEEYNELAGKVVEFPQIEDKAYILDLYNKLSFEDQADIRKKINGMN